jgi:hypothetical protein
LPRWSRPESFNGIMGERRLGNGGNMANLAHKRAKKAQRRKQAIAEKRRAEAWDASLPAHVLRAAHAPIRHCLLDDSLFDVGMGTLVLARGASSLHVEVGCFLIDVFCLGIKDVMFKTMEGEEFEMYMDRLSAASPMDTVDPSYARKLLRDLAAWSQSIGFAPHRDFAAVERIFGEVDADASEAVFQFGREGRPVYFPGPSESTSVVQRRIVQLKKHVGADGFDLEGAV